MGTPDQPAVDVLIAVHECNEAVRGVVERLPRGTFRHAFVVRTGAAAPPPSPPDAFSLATPRHGLGAAVLRGVEHLQEMDPPPGIVVVMAGDGSDDPADVPALLRPALKGGYDLVIGSRMLGPGRGASMSRLDRYGNQLAVQLIRVVYGYEYSDLSNFFAIRFPALIALGVNDAGAGFATELRVKALKVGLRIAEVPVARHGRRHVDEATETVRDKLDAGYRSLFQILRNATIR